MQTEDEDAIEAALDAPRMSVGEEGRGAAREDETFHGRASPASSSSWARGGLGKTRPRRASSAEADTIGMLGITRQLGAQRRGSAGASARHAERREKYEGSSSSASTRVWRRWRALRETSRRRRATELAHRAWILNRRAAPGRREPSCWTGRRCSRNAPRGARVRVPVRRNRRGQAEAIV